MLHQPVKEIRACAEVLRHECSAVIGASRSFYDFEYLIDVLEREAVNLLVKHTATYCNRLQHTATHKITQRHTSGHCIALHFTATQCNTLRNTRFFRIFDRRARARSCHFAGRAHCNTLQHTATHCNTLQHTATHCNALQRTSTYCYRLQHTAAHCNTLQLSVTHATHQLLFNTG